LQRRPEAAARQCFDQSNGLATDGSRRAAGGTWSRGMYLLGTLATVADAESIGVMLAWKEYDMVALDSQGGFGVYSTKPYSSNHNPPRNFLEECT